MSPAPTRTESAAGGGAGVSSGVGSGAGAGALVGSWAAADAAITKRKETIRFFIGAVGYRARERFMRTRACTVALLVFLGVARAALPQQDVPGLPDPFGLLEPKNFSAHRSSSNNPDWNSNDDSKRPIPGETTVLADLTGPGVVTHLWITIADNEYAWPRLLRLRVYYDGSATPSVDAPVGDFFAVGHGFEAKVKSLMVVDSSDGRARNSYWPMPFKKSARVTGTKEGRRGCSNLYYHYDWDKLAA